MKKDERPVLKFHQPFDYDFTNEGDLNVSGFSVHTGLYKDNAVEIPESELSNIASSLVGKQLRKDHRFSVDSIVGKITDTKLAMDDETKFPGVRYQGFVADEELAGKIQKGLVTDVSIGFCLTPICSECGKNFMECEHQFDTAHIIAKDIYCEEQSFVAQGADSDSTIEPGAHFNKALNDFQVQFDYKYSNDFQKQFDCKDSKGPEDSNAGQLLDKKAPKEKDSEPNGGNTMGEEKQEGEKVNFAEVFEKLSETQNTLAQKEQELSASKGDNEDLVSEIAQLKDDVATSKQQLNDIVAEKDKALDELKTTKEALSQKELADKKVEAEKLATEYVEKELIKKEDFDAKVESLIKLDAVGIEEAKELIAKFSKPASKKEKVQKFNNFSDPMAEKEEVEFEKLSHRDKMQRIVHEIFAYDRTYTPTPEVFENVSYMGFNEHEERANKRQVI